MTTAQKSMITKTGKIFKLGQRIAHKGTNENANVIYTGEIIGFDRLAIYFQNDNGSRYWLNSWHLCAYPKTVKN